jgi:nucleotide-binding universal stress UspA family protein
MERVVVGLDGSPPSRDALGWALGLADDLDGVEVVAVSACEDAMGAFEKGYCSRTQAESWLEESRAEARTALDDALTALGRGNDEVTLETIPGRPADVLVGASRDADLLVVGPRGHGRLRKMLGSVSQACVLNAHCPVVVVPLGDG